MARNKKNQSNIDNSDLVNYPNGRIKNNSGSGDGTPVDEIVYGDLHEFFAKLMRAGGISYNGLPDNEANGYQLIDALRAFASKNDFVLDIGTAGEKLTIATKIGILQTNESILCKATTDLGAQTVIRGSDNVDKTISAVGTFKNGEYVQLINTASAVVLVRLATAVNLDLMVQELEFLKAASNAQELAGLLDTVATTPMGNMLAFAEWVNGSPSAASLASSIRNGLYPKEHFDIVANIGNNRVRNIGWVSGLDPGGGTSGETFPVNGDFTQCQYQSKGNGATTWTVTMANAMDNTNYYVRIFLESQGTIDHDDDLYTPVFVPISTTQFRIRMDESFGNTQNVRAHMEVVQI